MKPARIYNQQRAYGKLLFVILFIGGLYSSIFINNISYESAEVISDSIFPIIPQTSDSFEDGDSINSTHVYLYLDGVKQSGIPDLKRGIQSLNITFNNTKHLDSTPIFAEGTYGEGNFFANITLNNGFEFNLSLTAVPSETRLWTTAFTQIGRAHV